MKKQVIPVIAALAVVGTFSAAVYAQTADRAIKYRQGIMGAQGWHMGVLGGMAKGTRPYDKDVAARSARYVDMLVEMHIDGFGAGTEKGAPTRAKADIWQQKAKFDKYAQDIKLETTKLSANAGNGLDALRASIGPVGRGCQNCHDDFQAKDYAN